MNSQTSTHKRGGRGRRNSPLNAELQSSESAGKNTSSRTIRTGKRSRTGCFTCRARKIKCDESQPTCQNCKRCVLACKWPVVEDLFAVKARRRMKHAVAEAASASTAGPNSRGGGLQNDASNPANCLNSAQEDGSATCTSCHAAEYRCSKECPVCERCREFGLVCKYGSTSPVDQQMQGVVSETNTQESLTGPIQHKRSHIDRNIDHVPKSLIHQHIQAFFTHIYPCQANGFIHRGTLLRNFQSGKVDRKLLLAICATASRFLDDLAKSTHDAGKAEAWAKEAKTLLILEGMSTDTVATALLLARHEVNCGDYSSAWMLSSIATRAALALGLNKESHADNAGLSFSEQETRRRLFWACYCLDRMMSTGLSELVVLRAEHIHLPLPCVEHKYLFGTPCWTPEVNMEVSMPIAGQEQSQAQNDIGMFGHYVQIMQIRYCILKYVRNHPEDAKELPPWDPSSTFAQCVHKMSTWKRSLSAQFQLLPDTICVRQSQNQLSPLIMLHVWYEQCMSDLYRIVMPGFPETLPASMLLNAPAGWVREHQLACVRHACGIASIFETVAAVVDMESFLFLDTSLPMCVFESICVRLQWLFMLPPEFLEERLQECNTSFKPLISYVERMSRYFRQAQWLLQEMRKMLFRHGIHINITTCPENNSDSPPADTGSHPWQRRIQRLKDEKAKSRDSNSQQVDQAIPEMTMRVQPIAVPTDANREVNHADVNLSTLPVVDESLYPLTQNVSFNDMLYQDSFELPPNGWGEAQVIPELVHFMGMSGEWVANGIEENPEL